MSNSSKTSKRNRKTARSLGYKGTEEAREAGVPLPTADEIADQNADATRPKVKPKFKPPNDKKK